MANYSLKRVSPSNSKNLIVGNSNKLYPNSRHITSISNAKQGDKFCLTFDSYNGEEMLHEVIRLEDDKSSYLTDFTFLSKDKTILITTRDSVGEVRLQINNQAIHYGNDFISNVMLVPGETPLPWENNLGEQEITIEGIKRNSGSKNLIKGDSSELYLQKNSSKQFDLVIDSIKKGDKLYISYKKGNGHTITTYDAFPCWISPKWQSGVDLSTIMYINSKESDSKGSIDILQDYAGRLSLNIQGGVLSLENIMLTKEEDDVVPWKNNIEPESSLSLVYKAEEQIWEKKFITPYIIKDDIRKSGDYADCTILLHPQLIESLCANTYDIQVTIWDFDMTTLRNDIFNTCKDLQKYNTELRIRSISSYDTPVNAIDSGLYINFSMSTIRYNSNAELLYEDGYIVCKACGWDD